MQLPLKRNLKTEIRSVAHWFNHYAVYIFLEILGLRLRNPAFVIVTAKPQICCLHTSIINWSSLGITDDKNWNKETQNYDLVDDSRRMRRPLNNVSPQNQWSRQNFNSSHSDGCKNQSRQHLLQLCLICVAGDRFHLRKCVSICVNLSHQNHWAHQQS